MGVDIRVSERAAKVRYAVRNIARKAKELEKQGKKMLYLNIGDPGKYDFAVPQHVVDACVNAMNNMKNYYGFSSGVDEAREAIARYAGRRGLKSVSAENVTVTTGVSEAVDVVMNALLNIGENVLCPAPNYPLYEAVANKIGAKVNFYYLNEEDGWQPDAEDMRSKVDDKTRAILLINPNNPTGAVYSKKILKEVVGLAAERKLPIISDEIYDQLLFDGEEHVATGSLTDEVPVITFGGLSKNYFATGWRVGWIVLSNLDAKGSFSSVINNLVDARLSSPTPAQFAVKAALEGSKEHLVVGIKKMQERRNITFKKLNEISGLSCVKPKGAFYAFPKVESEKYKDDEQFVLDLLNKEGVVVVHGSGFGQKEGEKHFRIVFLPQADMLNEAYDRIERFTESL